MCQNVGEIFQASETTWSVVSAENTVRESLYHTLSSYRQSKSVCVWFHFILLTPSTVGACDDAQIMYES